jgi:hypothetical protein
LVLESRNRIRKEKKSFTFTAYRPNLARFISAAQQPQRAARSLLLGRRDRGPIPRRAERWLSFPPCHRQVGPVRQLYLPQLEFEPDSDLTLHHPTPKLSNRARTPRVCLRSTPRTPSLLLLNSSRPSPLLFPSENPQPRVPNRRTLAAAIAGLGSSTDRPCA